MAEAPVPGSYAALVADFTVRLPARLHAAAACVAACDSAQAAAPALAAAADSVHKLAGSCGLYGYADVSEALSRLELRLVCGADFAQLGAELARLAAGLEPDPAGGGPSLQATSVANEPED